MTAPDRRRRGRPLPTVVLAAAVALLATGLLRFDLPSLSNPFRERTIERSGPALLTSLSNLARFQAATGSFQVVVDVEKDVPNVPDLIAGERTLFIAQGTVDASVDFTTIGEDAVTVSPDRSRVEVVLPAAALSEARVDADRSRVFARDRGVVDRLGGIFSDNPTSERELYQAAERKMEEAAEVSELRQRAEANTRSMLAGLLGSLGYADVQVEFTADDRR